MNAIAMLTAEQALRLANERAEEFRREAQHNRIVAARPRRSILGSLASTISSLRASLTAIEPDLGPGLPTLKDYPSRG